MMGVIPQFRTLNPGTRHLLLVIVCLSIVAKFFSWLDPALRFMFVLNILDVVYYPWTLITCSFVEPNLLVLAVNAFCFVSLGAYLERAFEKTSAFVQFVAVVAFGSTLATLAVVMLLSVVLAHDIWLYNMDIYGLSGIVNAFAIAYKQFVPEHVVKLLGNIAEIRVKYIPSVLFLMQLCFLLLGLGRTNAMQALFGMVIAWIYLRFFRYTNGVRGDLNEHFSFTSFFPDSFHKHVQPISTYTYRFFAAMHVCPPRASSRSVRFNPRSSLLQSYNSPASTSSQAARKDAHSTTSVFFNAEDPEKQSETPLNFNDEAQRHKQLGLKALEKQMGL